MLQRALLSIRPTKIILADEKSLETRDPACNVPAIFLPLSCPEYLETRHSGPDYTYRIMIIRFYLKEVSSDKNSIHKYLDRLPILFTRSWIRFLSRQALCRWALRSHLSFPILPGQAVHTCLGSENRSQDRFAPHFQRRINILRIEKGKLSG